MTWLQDFPDPQCSPDAQRSPDPHSRPDLLAIEVTAGPDTVVMAVTGDLDLITRPVLAERLSAVLASHPRELVLDLAGADFMDCGSARLVASARPFLAAGGRLVIRQPSAVARRVLQLTGYDAACEIEDLFRGASMAVTPQDVRHALNELGRLRFGEMRVEEAMHQVVQTTHAIFSVDGAGLMLADDEHHLRNAAVSDERVRHLEDLQIEHSEGPCITAFDEKVMVGAPDLAADQRWPAFSRAAVGRGVRAVLASPIPYNQDAIGVVAVLSEQEHPWSAEAELALLAFTDLAALLIASMMMSEQQTELAQQLQGALNSRAVIEQAKGVLIGQQGLSAQAAYEQIRARARAERRKVSAVAAELVRGAVRDH
jgi:anti-anti-sigma factor